MCDKANSDRKGAKTATFPKLLSLYGPDTGEIVELFLDCDSAGNSSADAEKAIDHSFKTKLFDVMPILFCGLTTDSGGGGTLHSLLSALAQLEDPIVNKNTRVTSCALHNVQTCLRNAVEEVFGAGGMTEKKVSNKTEKDFKMNAMQHMNGIYNLFFILITVFLKSSGNTQMRSCTKTFPSR